MAQLYPKITVSDEHDDNPQFVEFFDALEKGLIRRVSRVFIQDGDGRIFLQRRGPDLEILPSHWDISAGGHVDEGDTYFTAVRTEVREELGLVGLSYVTLGKWFVEESRNGQATPAWHMLYRATWSGSPLVLAEGEVAEGKWFTREAVDKLCDATDELVAPTLIANWRDCRAMLS